ncbi:uncharacterized protein LOC111712099 [Eurytemora carolleeae]|uniref:uncharacterized protein LOC111712099 n=1 Tax=Eurytemora carolleeae TaxID=1294199 RepID=UPI000C764CE8|nr:uncharacterized protein LOC111712099 [Eurytemora carolleeae]|eukprot:XP_023342385.1 uncharacterized protein LOC111712099 [Eurytemora affinis]
MEENLDRKIKVYSLRVTQLAPCIFVCYQTDIPLPGLETGLVLIGITPAGSARMRPISSVDPDEYIWAWDRLVYGCRIPNYGIEGGSDTVLDRYQCTNTSTYNAPNPKDPGSTGAWPKCRPQSYMVVDAAIKMLARYDERVENRYKLILFKELDGEDNITFNDHLISVTLPTVIVMVMIILVALFCSRNNSPICSICASKESAYED